MHQEYTTDPGWQLGSITLNTNKGHLFFYNEYPKESQLDGQTENAIYLNQDRFQQLCDGAGRVLDEFTFQEDVFYTEATAETRQVIWPLLLKLYPMSASNRERQIVNLGLVLKYRAMKTKLNDFMNSHKLEMIQSYVQRFRFEDDPEENAALIEAQSLVAWSKLVDPDYCSCEESRDIADAFSMAEFAQEEIQLAEEEAKIYASKQTVPSPATLVKELDQIDKDLIRIGDLFLGERRVPMVKRLRSLFLMYSAFPECSSGDYQQCESLVMEMLGYSLRSEGLIYWLYRTYRGSRFPAAYGSIGKQTDMSGKIRQMEKIIRLVDPDLFYSIVPVVTDKQTVFYHCCKPHMRHLAWHVFRTAKDCLRHFDMLLSSFTEQGLYKQIVDELMVKEIKKQGGESKLYLPELDAMFNFETILIAACNIMARDYCLHPPPDDRDNSEFIVKVTQSEDWDGKQVLRMGGMVFWHYCKALVNDAYVFIDKFDVLDAKLCTIVRLSLFARLKQICAKLKDKLKWQPNCKCCAR